jgi:hypothetical protein
MANQLYCEYKVHLQHTHPEVVIELPSLEWGEAGHAGLASVAEPITAEEIDEALATGKELALCEWTLEGVFREARLRGRPDFFAFAGKDARLLLDFKFSGTGQPFPDQIFQVELYALLAEQMGFRIDELCLGVVKFPRHRTGGGLRDAVRAKADLLRAFETDGTLFDVAARCERERAALLRRRGGQVAAEGDGWTAYLFRFDRTKAEKGLNWSLDFWLQEREPIPETRLPNKCFACPFNALALCEHALKPADEAFEVRRDIDDTVHVTRPPAVRPRRARED